MARGLLNHMSMAKPSLLTRFGRLFVVKTRWEAWAVTWAIALGAVERGKHYLEIYPGTIGWLFFAACVGVVFLAGAKLLDAVRPAPALAAPAPVRAPIQPPVRRARMLSRNRPRAFRQSGGAMSRPSRRKD